MIFRFDKSKQALILEMKEFVFEEIVADFLQRFQLEDIIQRKMDHSSNRPQYSNGLTRQQKIYSHFGLVIDYSHSHI